MIAVTIALCGLALSMWMNWRFGWSQAVVSEDRAAIAGKHMLADSAAAVLTVIGGDLSPGDGDGQELARFYLL
jgi:hypothetical protein